MSQANKFVIPTQEERSALSRMLKERFAVSQLDSHNYGFKIRGIPKSQMTLEDGALFGVGGATWVQDGPVEMNADGTIEIDVWRLEVR